MKKILSIALILSLCMMTILPFKAEGIDHTSIEGYYKGHKYAVYDLSINWEEAKDFCDSLGGHLVTITNASEQDFIRTLIGNGESYFYWMGATDIKTEGTWEWITGEPWEYTNWITKQPDNGYTGEDFLTIELSGWNDLRLNGDNGGNNTLERAGFICEWESVKPVSSVSLAPNIAQMKVGDTLQLQARCFPANATNKAIAWSSDNNGVASVDNNGIVRANRIGYATITARSSNGKTAECNVEVNSKNELEFYDYMYSFWNSADRFGYSDDYRIPIERYLQAGYSKPIATLFALGKWGGNCFGMSTSSILFYMNELKEERYNSSKYLPRQFEAPISDNYSDTKLRHMIELLQVSQKLDGYNKFRDFKTLREELEEGRPVLFILANMWGFDAHAVVIYDYYYDDEEGYTYNIYDCSYSVSALEVDESGYRLMDAGKVDTVSENYVASYFVSFDSVERVYRKIKNNNIKNAASLFSFDNAERKIYIKHIAEDLQIKNEEGKLARIVNGELNSEFEGIEIATNSYLEDDKNCFIILPSNTYTIVGSGDEEITTSFADDYMSVSVTAKSSTPITISSDLKEISVDTVSDDEYDITYTTWDNIFDEMTLTGTATGTIISTLDESEVTISGVNTLTASASVSDSKVSANSDNLADSNEITIRCEEDAGGATIQLLNADAELTEKTALPERLTVDMPAYDLESGTYTEGQVLNFTKDDDTIVYYTTDGSIPSADNGIIYSLPIDINKSMTVKAISTKYGYSDSEVLELNYTLPEVDVPLADVASGEYDKVITVELSTGSYDDEIYYTLDGSNPLENGILYTVPLNISEDTYLQAYTLRNGCISEISEYEYTITPEYPFHISNSLTNQNGEIITADNISDITKVRVTVSKLQEGEHTGIFFVEFYDAEENLLSTKSTEAIISEDTDVVEVDITDDVSSACTVKAFVCEDSSGTQLMCEEYKETFRDVAEENLAAAEETKETVSALADGSAETSALIDEINAEIDTMLEDGAISADEAAKINTLKKQAKMSCGVLNLRFQIASGTSSSSEKSDMRFISTVDSPDYRETGFYITINGTKKRIATRNVYSSLVGKDGSAVTTYAPGDIFSESKWFSTYSIWNIPNSAFDSPITVQAFVVNPDGTETLGVEKTRTVRNFIRK